MIAIHAKVGVYYQEKVINVKNKEKTQTMNVDIVEILLNQRIAVIKVALGFIEEADFVASHLREADYKEVKRSSGRCPRKIVNASWSLSDMKWIIFFDRKPVALFGVVDMGNDIGTPWMVATDNFHNIAIVRYFIQNCKNYIKEFFQRSNFVLLYNCVDVENKSSKKWLEWCGFTMEEVIEYGAYNHKFQKFSMPRSIH